MSVKDACPSCGHVRAIDRAERRGKLCFRCAYPLEHGCSRGYNRGCRCDECRAWNTAKAARHQKKRKALDARRRNRVKAMMRGQRIRSDCDRCGKRRLLVFAKDICAACDFELSCKSAPILNDGAWVPNGRGIMVWKGKK